MASGNETRKIGLRKERILSSGETGAVIKRYPIARNEHDIIGEQKEA